MLTIGVIGLGTIAQKAYLPVYAQMQNQVHWLLNTRNEDKLEQLSAQYGLKVQAIRYKTSMDNHLKR